MSGFDLDKYKKISDIDVSLDFSNDPECRFWLPNKNVNSERLDPDTSSRFLRRYHYLLWNNKKISPNRNEKFGLIEATDMNDYLVYDKKFRFGADCIINLYTHHNNEFIRNILKNVRKQMGDSYKIRENEYIHKSYTIGANLIFPKHRPSINTVRGNIYGIADRIDLTMECIRRWYENRNDYTPLSYILNEYDAWFFEKFETFENYIDFFLMQDLVSRGADGKYNINFFLKRNAQGDLHGYPENENEWFELYDNELSFLDNRNKTIANYISEII